MVRRVSTLLAVADKRLVIVVYYIYYMQQGVLKMKSLFDENERKNYSLCEDWTFHYVFSKDSEASRQALIELLNVILDKKEDPIKHVRILNPVHYGWQKNGKRSVLDIKAEASSGELIDIEMQNGKLEDYGHRSLKYGASLTNSSLEKGQDYDKMRKSIVISIVTGTIFPQLEGVHNVFCIQNVKDNNSDETVLMTDRLEFHFLELGKIDGKKSVSDLSEVEKVAAYLKYAGDETHEAYTVGLLKEGGRAIAMMEYVFKELTADDIAREIQFSEQMAEWDRITQEKRMMERANAEGRAEGMEKGMAEGMQQGMQQGSERINRLNQKLAELGRVDDIIRAAADGDFQQKLMKELGIE